MAQNQSPALFAVALLLFAATSPLALAQPPPALPVGGPILPTVGSLLSGIMIKGSLCCTPTGNCPGGAPLAGVSVTATCRLLGGTTVNVGRAITGVNGNFSITLGSSIIQVLGPIAALTGGNIPIPCTVNATLPLSDTVCPLLNLFNSTLTSTPIIVGNVVSLIQGLFGIANVIFQVLAS